MIGAMGELTLFSIALTAFVSPVASLQTLAVRTLSAVGVATFLFVGFRGFANARAYAVEQQAETEIPRKNVSLDVIRFVHDEHATRPLFVIAPDVWIDAVCVVLHVYKDHPKIAVEPRWVPVFGDALAPDGTEDVEVHIANASEHEALSSRPGDRVIAAHGGLFVHARRNAR